MPRKQSAPKRKPTTRTRQQAAPKKKYVHFFGGGSAEGDRTMRDLLGGKGANLAEMTNAGLPVPPGFTISTDACTAYYEQRRRVPAAIDTEMDRHLARLEELAGAQLGSAEQPLLVSVRSGSKFSMPGMMDTILNLGLNDRAVEGLKARTSNGRFAFDSYRRFIQMFGNVVLEIPKEAFEEEFDGVKANRGVELDTELDEIALREVVDRFKAVVIRESGEPFPLDPRRQLRMARDAVFRSWQNPRAKEYRRIYDIPDAIGTAVNVQAMVFGNTGERSGTGVGFTRNPSTGANEFYGEFLINAQGEDVVAGIRTPQPIHELEHVMPRAYDELRTITKRLEQHYRDVQDFEFTIENEKLYMLQTRNGKRTGHAAVVIATDLVDEGVIEPADAVRMVDPDALTQLLAPVFEPAAWRALPTVTRGLPASPGAACGEVVFTADEAVRWAGQGRDVLLVRKETVPDDIHGMHVARGVLTATGGMTSHAAVVGRQMGKPSVVGAGELHVSETQRIVTVNGERFEQGDYVSFDGLTGEVKIGRVPTKPSEILQVLSGELSQRKSDIYRRFSKLLKWADKIRRLGIRANADQPDQAATAYAFGARGIGLCRTEHMFFGEERIPIVQRMILAETEAERRMALDELLPMQREDFYGVFQAMRGQPVTIRLIDPPLHEFLPKREELMVEIARDEAHGRTDGLEAKRALLRRVEQLHEFNPMMGHRGVRLAISYPEIAEMQARAIMEAACRLAKEGAKVIPEIMIPLVGHVGEFQDQKAVIDRVAAETITTAGVKVKYLVGTMIEIPRSVLVADAIAADADFFSFGTNDLTQMAFGFSRDDIAKFLKDYQERGILTRDPFETIDTEGVGALIRIGADRGRAAKPKLKLGVCGEHGGDPASIYFFDDVGLDYVSASPFRVPTARLAAAQATLAAKD
ncbi:MAG: pyruvate, phosphate dikinase [Acidobacteria bacterium]|nr:pyruvate, phosphate dikinase [Acidobacteriota bacterium]MYJ06194.1 pyruvate, phosphate dikinase [Acidobacteriota bacterium]